MKIEGFWKHALITFVIALVFYIVGFWWIQQRREDKGPWEVVFMTDNSGSPSILILQPKLKISQKVNFRTEKLERPNYVHAKRFDVVTESTPFGKVIFQDPTFLPGTLTLELFGHEVELLPRVLIVDKEELAWRSGEDINIKIRRKIPQVKKEPPVPAAH